MGGAGGEDSQRAVAAQARRAHLQSRLVFQGLVEEEQQPDMADLLQAFQRFHLVERRQRFRVPRAAGASSGWRGMANFSMKQERM